MLDQDRSRRFLVAPDSFKGTLAAVDAADAIAAGLQAAGASVDLCPVADGGEGTAETICTALAGGRHKALVHDPLGRPIEAEFVLVSDGATAVVDAAAASGLPLVAPAERDAEAASTYGTGELLAAAAASGARRILLAAGGTATTDGGRGAISAVHDSGGLGSASLEVLCDVFTPFEEASRVFGPQKGADVETVIRLSERLDRTAVELPRDPRGVPMTGCAGGLSGGLWATFGARLRPGAAFILNLVGFDRRLRAADVAISGEGRVDSQSLEGKLVGHMALACAQLGRDLHLLVGQNKLDSSVGAKLGIRSIREAGTIPLLEKAAREIGEETWAPGTT